MSLDDESEHVSKENRQEDRLTKWTGVGQLGEVTDFFFAAQTSFGLRVQHADENGMTGDRRRFGVVMSSGRFVKCVLILQDFGAFKADQMVGRNAALFTTCSIEFGKHTR